MGNPITNTLPPSLDNFLQDMAQMYAEFDYSDVSKFADRATADDIKALRKLYRKSIEAREYDDDDTMAEITCAVEDLVLGNSLAESKKKHVKESQDADCCDEDDCDCDGAEWGDKKYVLGCCSFCGAEGTDTVEHFLIDHGFDDVEFACDLLNVDPYEEVCKECFEAWIPELNNKYYSEYDDLGTDTRTGESFPYRESAKKKNKKSLKESEGQGVRNALDCILAEEKLVELGWTETNEGIEVTFSKDELSRAAPEDIDPEDYVAIANRIMAEYGVTTPNAEFVTEEEGFITLNFPYHY